jgi:hypothetical protein
VKQCSARLKKQERKQRTEKKNLIHSIYTGNYIKISGALYMRRQMRKTIKIKRQKLCHYIHIIIIAQNAVKRALQVVQRL